MRNRSGSLKVCVLLFLLVGVVTVAWAESGESTRLSGKKQSIGRSRGNDVYRGSSEYVIKELDLKPGDVVVDIGAGDGWWASKMAPAVGKDGIIHAGEIDKGKVDKIKGKYGDIAQIKPYICPLDNSGMEENSCDLAFISKTYHHFNKDDRPDYLKHLHQVIKPTGRLVIIERDTSLAVGRSKDHAYSPGVLAQEAAQAGWVLLRHELMRDTGHFIAIFAQTDAFEIPAPRKQ